MGKKSVQDFCENCKAVYYGETKRIVKNLIS